MTKKIWLILITFVLLFSAFAPLASATVYTYTFIGPYYDDGTVPNDGFTTVTLYYANSTAYSFLLQASGTTPATVIQHSTVRITQAVWNASTNNNTRIFTYQGTAADEDSLYVHILDPAKAYFEYTFSIADFFGMTNPYLETATGHSGDVAVERQSLNSSGVVSFLLAQYVPYNLVFICNEGTHVQPFTPGVTLAVNLQVLAGFFPSTVTNDSLATVTRSNDTTITITYVDPDSATDWLYIAITHQDGAYIITDDSHNYTSSANSVTRIATADNETDYYVQVQSYRYGGVIEWDFACPILHATNPFNGLLDFLGTWPTGFDPAQLFAAAIIMCALGLGSFRSAGVSCMLAWILAGVFLAIGWFTISVPMLALAGVLSVLVVLTEGKETTRDV